MSIVIRDVREHELDAVLALNNAAGSTILPLDAARLQRFHREADYFRVAEKDGLLAGFLVAFAAGSAHDSPNFAWFKARYPDFVYIDRIVVASSRRGAGLGRVFYADVQSWAEVRSARLACEVFLEPGNDPAMLFHGTFGFQEVGQQVMPNVDKHVALLMKEFCSYPWVAATYGGALPDLPWLASRLPAAAAARATGT